MLRIAASSLLALALIFSALTAHARLGKDWREKYTPGDEWQSVCAYEGGRGCPAANTYLYRDSLAVVQLTTSGRPNGYHHFYVATYEGQCTGGSVSIDGEKRFDLEKYRDYCRVAGDLLFVDEGMPRSTKKTLPVGMLQGASQMDIILNTADGKNVQISVPMTGFDSAFKQSAGLVTRR